MMGRIGFGGGGMFSEGFFFPRFAFGGEWALVVDSAEEEVVLEGSFFDHGSI